MCQANVESRQTDSAGGGKPLPVFFASELIAAAISGDYPKKQQKVHLVPPDVLTNFILQSVATREGAA
jgi:hypothetical protein